jgi:protein-disulfide isomerase
MKENLVMAPHQNDHRLGSLNSPVILVQYGDYECPYCAETLPWIDQLLRDYRGEVCFIYRHYPLTDLHANSAFAAAAAEVASKSNLFWKMHHLLFQNQKALSGETIFQLASSIHMDVDQFLKESDQEEIMEIICQDMVGGEESGVKETPTYFINGKKTLLGRSYESLREAVEDALKDQSQPGHSQSSIR